MCFGFSIVELLTVVAVLTTLATLAVPALGSLAKGGGMNSSLIELAGLLSQARQYAVSQNTYVWVALRPNSDQPDDPALSVVVLASKDGQDPSPWSDYGPVPNTTIALLTKPKTFRQIRMEEAGTFGAPQIGSLASLPAATSANSPASSASFRVPVPGSSSAQNFTRTIQFLPDGQARVAAGPIDLVELGLRPMRGATPNDHNVAVLRINGLTGQTTVYRP